MSFMALIINCLKTAKSRSGSLGYLYSNSTPGVLLWYPFSVHPLNGQNHCVHIQAYFVSQ